MSHRMIVPGLPHAHLNYGQRLVDAISRARCTVCGAPCAAASIAYDLAGCECGHVQRLHVGHPEPRRRRR